MPVFSIRGTFSIRRKGLYVYNRIYIYNGGIYSVYSIYSIYKWVISYNHGSWVLNGEEADMILEEIHYH